MSDQAAYDVETILLRLKEIVETGRSMPMSASVLVNREEFIELLDESIADPAPGAAPRALAAQGARAVPRPGPPRSRRHHRGGAGPGRADGGAHRGGA